MPNLLKELEITEISLVDVPANEGAKVVLFKRDTNRRKQMSEKKTWFQAIAEKAGFSKEETEELEKTIPDNTEEIAELKKQLEAKQGEAEEVTKLQARIDELEKVAKPEPKPEDIWKGVSTEVKEKFEAMEKSLEDSKGDTKKAQEEATEARKDTKVEKDARELAEFTKTAEKDYPNLPGTPEEKGRLLKSLSEKFEGKDLETALKMFKAGDEGVAKSLVTLGVDGIIEGGGLEKITKFAKELLAKGDFKTMAKAMVEAENQNPEWAKEYYREQQ